MCDIYMYLWGVTVLELNRHPDHNKEPYPPDAVVLRTIPFTDPNNTYCMGCEYILIHTPIV